MSTTMIVATSASTQATVAASQVHNAQVTACQTFMPQFSGATATADQARTYAKCVDLIYPGPASSSEVLFIKVMILAALIGIVIGVYNHYREYSPRFGWFREPVNLLAYTFFGAVLGPAVIFFGALLVHGVKYLLTA